MISAHSALILARAASTALLIPAAAVSIEWLRYDSAGRRLRIQQPRFRKSPACPANLVSPG
ncbi:uncharacterized protein THITE_2116676 [Thermothielavioides terrestris NRRL 8126]|uniref:Uncharacterized protein n=1 Tax=Thermothielavioides terrestris (strain ATCC 38088 / NRRL 8126) TaxID=578455 RepID=G2R6Z6_THETT|nr:uncharacterized protein THITE_2116676 [Thermothielavioides terrestris NRRL 8126]AEO67724.1 hypothetical protein THITE_2116676 [Thermothielavioides terrestris NRRL 8126]